MKIKKFNHNGFTLVELAIVVLLIGILSSLAIPKFLEAAKSSKQAEADQLLKAAYKLVIAYEMEYGNITSTQPGLIGQLGGETEGRYFRVWGPEYLGGYWRWRIHAIKKPEFPNLTSRHIHPDGTFHDAHN